MARKGELHYIDTSGPDDDALLQGLRWLVAQAQSGGGEGLVAVWSRAVLVNIASWSKYAALFTELRDLGVVRHEQVSLRLFTSQDTVNTTWKGPILVIYGTEKLLDLVDAVSTDANVLYIPWAENYTNWVATSKATKLPDTSNRDEGAPPPPGS